MAAVSTNALRVGPFFMNAAPNMRAARRAACTASSIRVGAPGFIKGVIGGTWKHNVPDVTWLAIGTA